MLNLPRGFFFAKASEHEKTKTPSAKKSGFCIDLWASWEEHYGGNLWGIMEERGSGPLPDGQPFPSNSNLDLFVFGDFFYELYHGKSP